MKIPMNKQIKNFTVDPSDISLLEYNNIFVANLTWVKRRIHNDVAVFDLVVRELPPNWNFFTFDGLERFINLLLNFTYDEEAITLLKKMNLIDSPEIEKIYRNFKFSGDISAMKDGTIFFPGEPIVRITAPLFQANLLTAFAINAFCYPIRILSKTLRVKFSIGTTIFLVGSLVRLPGFEQGIWPLRAAFLLDSANSSPFFFRKFPEFDPPNKITANINHAVIKSFPTERDAYRYVLDELVHTSNFLYIMVDTYDLRTGLDIFINEVKMTPTLDMKKIMLTIDSGNIQKEAFYMRKKLDQDGLKQIRIQAMSNLDEYKIDKMVKEKTPVDLYITATSLINTIDAPTLELVYKMAELRHRNGEIEYKAKLTKGKESYPGCKQVFRKYNSHGIMIEDVIGLDNEKLGEPLLIKYIKKGKLIRKVEGIEEIKKNLCKNISSLPKELTSVYKNGSYKLRISKKLGALLEKVKKKNIKNKL